MFVKYCKNGDLDLEYDTLISQLNRWINLECNGPLAYNYGLIEIKNEIKNINSPKKLIENLQSFEEIKTNGTRNEAILFDGLLSLNIPFDIDDNAEGYYLDERYFIERILDFLHNRLSNTKLEDLLQVRLKYNFSHLKNKKKIEDQFDQVILTNLLENLENIRIVCHMGTEKPQIVQKIVSELLEKKWPKNRDLDQIVVQFDLFQLLVEIHLENLSKKKIDSPLNENWQRIFATCLSEFKKCLNNLLDGNIQVGRIKLLESNFQSTLRIAEFLINYNQIENFQISKEDLVNLKKLIEFRQCEMNRILECKNLLTAIIQFCAKNPKSDSSVFKQKLEELNKQNIDRINLNHFCKILDFKSIKTASIQSFKPNIFYFPNIGQSEFDLISKTINLNRLKCVLFDFYFNETCDEQKETKIDLIRILNQIIPSTFEKWRALANEIDSGKIKLSKIDLLLSKHFENNSKKLLQEIYYILDECQIRNKEARKNQLELYTKLQSSIDTARLIEKIRQVYEIENKFIELNELLNIDPEQFKNWTLLNMDSRLESTIRVLEEYSSKANINCLQAYLEAIELNKWLKINVKDLRELKFFVDLISITKSSEYSQHNTNKDVLAKTLKEACIGYAPLIFNSNKNDNFRSFIENCRNVFINVKNDGKIPEKLRAVKDQVPFLDHVKVKKEMLNLAPFNKPKK